MHLVGYFHSCITMHGFMNVKCYVVVWWENNSVLYTGCSRIRLALQMFTALFFFIMTKSLTGTEHKIPIHVSELQHTQIFNAAHIWRDTLPPPQQISFPFFLSSFTISFFPSFFLYKTTMRRLIPHFRTERRGSCSFPAPFPTDHPQRLVLTTWTNNLPSEAARSTSSWEISCIL